MAVLLSTHNGAEFLEAQLDSLVAQTCTDWRLHWRDDGSSDATAALMHRFRHGPGRGRVVVHPPGRLGVTASYLALLRAADGNFIVPFYSTWTISTWLLRTKKDKLFYGWVIC